MLAFLPCEIVNTFASFCRWSVADVTVTTGVSSLRSTSLSKHELNPFERVCLVVAVFTSCDSSFERQHEKMLSAAQDKEGQEQAVEQVRMER